MKRKIIMIISILMTFSLLSCLYRNGIIFAEEDENNIVFSYGETIKPDEQNNDNEELLKSFIEQAFHIEQVNTSKVSKSNRDKLKGFDLALFDKLASQIILVANGELESTVFTFGVDELDVEKTSFTAEDLGVEYIYNNGYNQEAIDRMREKTSFDFSLVLNTLLFDHPYELYWYDKTTSTSYNGPSIRYSLSDGVETLTLTGEYTFNFPVCKEYAGEGEYAIDTSIGETINESVNNAMSIVSSYSREDDYSKLCWYKKEICNRVSYNFDALGTEVSYGNPWQLVWVFDDNNDTNVVCEGYSKAFQYLCDNTDFDSNYITCYSVNGTMVGGTGAGRHMWNIVTMDDGKNYLADITNCDSGTIGADDKLFLVGIDIDDDTSSVESGYVFYPNNHQITYVYDEAISKIYTNEELTIAKGNYSYSVHVDPTSGTAYAVLTEDGDFIFFRSYENYSNGINTETKDIYGNTFSGVVYTNIENTPYYVYSIPWQSNIELIKNAYVAEGNTIKPTMMHAWFYGAKYLKSFDGEGIDTSDVDDMSQLFQFCTALRSINISNFDTTQLTNMNSMFANCSSLKTVDLSHLDVSNVSSMGYLFGDCSYLESVNFSNLDMSNVIDMSNMFSNCTYLEEVVFSDSHTSNVTNVSNMFSNCSSLESLDLSNFDTTQVTDMSGMFSGCSSLSTLDISNFDTNNVTNMSRVFSDCSSFKALDISAFDTRNVTDMSSMFSNCSSLESLDLSNFDTTQVTDMSGMFSGCSSISTLDLSELDVKNVIYMGSLFSGCSSLNSIDLSNFTTNKATDMSNMFADCSSIVELDLNGLYTGKVTNMVGMFFGCSSMTELDLSNCDTNNVEYMDYMFYNCDSLSSIDVSSFNTSNVINMSQMFGNCSSLELLDLSGFDTTYVTDMNGMFLNCTSLSSLNMHGFDTRNVNNMSSMFCGCNSLTELDISDYDTRNVSNMRNMFYGCDVLRRVIFGKRFTVWTNNAYLPTNSSWVHGDIVKTAYELYSEYTANASEWYGLWERQVTNIEQIDFSINKRVLFVGEDIYVNAYLKPEDATITDLQWLSSDNSIASVENGYVRAKSEGEVTITAKAKDGSGIEQSVTLRIIDGYYYAVLGENGDLVFIESNEKLDESTYGAIKDVNENIYTGFIYTGLFGHTNWGELGDRIKRVYVAEGTKIYVNDLDYLFSELNNLESFDGGGIDTRYSRSFVSTFANCISLKSVDLKGFITDDVTNMSGMFSGCSSLKTLDLGNFITDNVTDMGGMFYNCASLSSLNVNGFNTSNVTNMSWMFNNCSSLKSLDISSFVTNSVNNMHSMFSGCVSLTHLDLSNFDTSNVTEMGSMFWYCNSLTTLNISSFNTSNVTSMSGMFDSCDSLEYVEIGKHFVNWIDYSYLPVGTWTNGNLIKTEQELYDEYPYHTSEWFGIWKRELIVIESLTLPERSLLISGDQMSITYEIKPNNASNKNLIWTSSNEDVATVVDGIVRAINEGEVVITATARDASGISASVLIKVVNGRAYAIQNSADELVFFRSNENYDNGVMTTVIDTNGNEYTGVVYTGVESGEINWMNDIKKVFVADNTIIYPRSLSQWFARCYSLESFNGRGIDASFATNMDGMFTSCINLKEADFNGFITSNITNMEGMFGECNSIESLDLSSFDTRSVTNMSDMFFNCTALNTLNLSSFITSNVINMKRMFSFCKSLTVLDLSHFNTRNVVDMSEMFSGCNSLVSLNICDFDTSSVVSMSNMFNVGKQNPYEEVAVDPFTITNKLDSIKLGLMFIKWIDYSLLPSGIWTNGNLSKTELELYNEYPLHAQEWAGTWTKQKTINIPEIISTSMNTKGVTLKWSAVTGADEYVIYRKEGTGDYEEVGRSATTSFVDETAWAGTKYTYAVKAHSNSPVAYSEYSAGKTLTYNPFTDVKSGTAHYKNIMWAFNVGLVNGTSKTTFSPEGTCMRKSFAIMLWKLNGRPSAGGTNPFTDLGGLTKNEKAAIQWCYENKIVNGLTKTTFGPEGDVTRKAVVIMLWKAAGKPTPTITVKDSKFTDISKLTKNEQSAILWAFENGITKGTTKTTFGPEENCLREQLCTFLARYNNLLHIMD